jgi:hypothetical protein
MTALSYSQNTYPKKIVWNNDTIIAITPNHLIQINIKFEEAKYCNSDLEDSKRYIKEIEELSHKKDSLLTDYAFSIRNLNMLYYNLDSLATQIENDNKKLYNQNVKLRKNIRLFTGVSFTAGAALILILK